MNDVAEVLKRTIFYILRRARSSGSICQPVVQYLQTNGCVHLSSRFTFRTLWLVRFYFVYQYCLFSRQAAVIQLFF